MAENNNGCSMIELWTSFTLECSHTLEQPIGIPVLHGHSYWVQVFYETSAKNPIPLPMLNGCAELMKNRLDHTHLNDLLTQPTMESLAEYVYTYIQGPRPTKIVVERKSIGVGVIYKP